MEVRSGVGVEGLPFGKDIRGSKIRLASDIHSTYCLASVFSGILSALTLEKTKQDDHVCWAEYRGYCRRLEFHSQESRYCAHRRHRQRHGTFNIFHSKDIPSSLSLL
jgi:hypothetical protein